MRVFVGAQPPPTDVVTPVSRGAAPASRRTARPRVHGKFLFLGDEKLYVRGVTYGAFQPDKNGAEYHDLAQIERDFALMARHGFNAVRIPHTAPPRALLDIAERHGLWVMVGLSAEQYLGYLLDGAAPPGAPDIEELIRTKVRPLAGHPALLCYALGNEIPASVARFVGSPQIERYLQRLYSVVKEEDPAGLVTYVNYPTTEYLRLPFLDFACFNVYLESQDRFEAYLARLQNIVGDRPLLMSELGLDSLRNGEEGQAHSLEWQVRSAFGGGCAGVFVFAWTDDWYRHGHDVEDWEFGLTRVDRTPKPALAAVETAFANVPFPAGLPWPRVSVVVCSYNGSRTIRDTLEGLARLRYPDYEVIVVDDGSRDSTAAIAKEYDCVLIRTENRGLSNARNTGLAKATGEIVAYIDDDAYPDPDWLTYLAATFLTTPHAGVGGPNLAPPGDGPIAECVARAPGGPLHVLLTDTVAEHIPGCNMAFRKAWLDVIGGFDPQFRTAGDDVDLCWRLQSRGWTLGFHPAAVVWHHRRNSLRTYWRQQIGYGRAEAMLELKWPEKYNGPGHVRWGGRIYGPGLTRMLGWRRSRVYHGVWGGAPFQSRHEPAHGLLAWLPQMPEWHLLTATLGALSLLSVAYPPLRLVIPLLGLALVFPTAQASATAARLAFPEAATSASLTLRRLLTAALHVVQPLARLYGRLKYGLTPWRRRATLGLAPLWPVTSTVWSEHWEMPERRLQALDACLRGDQACVLSGGGHDAWDMEVRGGILGAARVVMGAEDHAGAKQLLRLRWWPVIPTRGPLFALALAALAVTSASRDMWGVAVPLAVGALLPLINAVEQSMAAMATIRYAVERLRRERWA